MNTSLNYSIYTGGRLKANVDAASANLGAQRFQEFQTALDLKLTVADAYVLVLRSVRALRWPGRTSPGSTLSPAT